MKLDFVDQFNEPVKVALGGQIAFFVAGVPAPGGSKRAFALKKNGAYTGRVAITDAAGQRNKDWRAAVAWAGRQAAPPQLLRGPLAVEFTFVMPRPKFHFYTSKKRLTEVRDSAPKAPTGKPDVLKLSRSTEDALTGVVWADDSQTVQLTATKQYGEKPGCYITITALPL